MSAGQDKCDLLIGDSIWLPDCSSIPCFYTVFTLLYFIIILPFVIYCYLYVFLPIFLKIFLWLLFVMCTLSVNDIALDCLV